MIYNRRRTVNKKINKLMHAILNDSDDGNIPFIPDSNLIIMPYGSQYSFLEQQESTDMEWMDKHELNK